ncbi:MAG: polyphosphate kinase 1 [Candidatus Xenobia bacterium]
MRDGDAGPAEGIVLQPSTNGSSESVLAVPDGDEIRPDLFFNRELSWLEFNARVLEEAKDASAPLLERLKFVAIFSSNLDEFFMVRYSGVWRQVDAGVETPSRDGLPPRKVLESISRRVHEMVGEQHRLLEEELLPALAAEGVRMLEPHDLNEEDRVWLRNYFNQTLMPIITPMAIDPGHPFPYIANRSLCLVAEVEPGEAWGIPSPDTIIIHIPVAGVPRFIRVPTADKKLFHFVLLEDLIRMNIDRLYPDCRIVGCTAIRVTRDAELELSGEQADLLSTIEEALRRRRMGAAVRLQFEQGLSPRLLATLTRELELDPIDLFQTSGTPALTDLMQLYSQVDLPGLKDRPFVPQHVPAFENAPDVFSAIRNDDILVHHPYQDFEVVVRFILAAATDPDVLAIKMTLYRVSGNSAIGRALTTAARNGKEVAVLVELRARFDEEVNIAWARRLESMGAHVIYGIAGFKTHSKAALVVRRERDGIRRYCHLSTGNYNDQTARVYADLGLFTCRQGFGEDLTNLFNLLTGYARPRTFNHLTLAPINLRDIIIAKIHREVTHSLGGRKGRIILKCNGLSDPVVIQELYQASQAGVSIDMLVRGICCMRPGVPGLSDNIRVISIVDRFLEHARIYYFENAGEPEYLLSSADLMGRNLFNRIEIAFPVLSQPLRQELWEILQVQLADNVKARLLSAESRSTRVHPEPGQPVVRSQDRFIDLAIEKARRSVRADAPVETGTARSDVMEAEIR